MAAYLSPAGPRAAALPFAGLGSCLRGVGVPDKAAFNSAGASLPRGRSAGRSHPAAGCKEAGASAGCSAAWGEGGRLPAQNQLDQLGANPCLLQESRSRVPGSGAGGGTQRSGSG